MSAGPAFEPPEAEREARRLREALDLIEARLDSLALGADADAVAEALAEPVRAFDAAARAALGRRE
jgi:hypothetical protein